MPDAPIPDAPVPDRGASTMRNLWTVVRMAFAADPLRAFVVLVPVQSLLFGLVTAYSREVVDAAVRGDRSGFAVAVTIEATAVLAWVGLGLASFTIRMRLQENVGVVLDARMMRAVGGAPTVEHHDDPALADAIELLRTNRTSMLGAIGAIGFTVSTGANVLIAAGLLATVTPEAVVLPLAGVPLWFLSKRAAAIQQRANDDTAEEARAGLHLFDLATEDAAAEEIRVLGLRRTFRERYRRSWVEVADTRTAADVRAALWVSLGALSMTAGLGAVLAVVASSARAGDVSPGDLVLVFGVLADLAWQLRFLAQLGGWAATVAIDAGRLVRLESHRAAVEASMDIDPGATPPPILRRGIVLRGVAYRYPIATTDTLSDVDLELPAGSTVAIVGDNGAGKSTLIDLLTGLRRPTRGVITADDVDLATLDPAVWHARTAAGFQDHARFELLAHETIGVADLPTLGDRERAARSLGRAGADDVIGQLPEGLDTPLGSTLDGTNLSGGQWQKLALGRAMHRDAPIIVVLDEPTSALDAETEHRLFARYTAEARRAAEQSGAVTVLVSHRFSTVRMADLIVVVDDGRITESGTHEALRAAGGRYAELYELQAAAYR